MIILTVGIFVDKRFNLKRKLFLLLLLVIQLLVYYYLELIPILLIKDLFWYSLLLNMCYI